MNSTRGFAISAVCCVAAFAQKDERITRYLAMLERPERQCASYLQSYALHSLASSGWCSA